MLPKALQKTYRVRVYASSQEFTPRTELGSRINNGDNSAMTAAATTALKKRPPLTPPHWLSWMTVGLIWLLGRAPQRLGTAFSLPLGWLMFHSMKRRRRIAQRNIERCFPELPPDRQQQLLRDNFRSLARMVFETAWSWTAPDRRFQKMGRVEGIEHMRTARARGRGVLAITHHVTCLEIGGRLASLEVPDAGGVYRPLNNPVLEWYQNRCRARYSKEGISKRDMRSAIRFLRKGNVLWYAPDQDFGPKRSVFAPFFGIKTATLEATARLVELTGCAIVPMFPVYDAKTRQYTVRIYPAMEGFPSGDVLQDLTRLNAMMEEHVRMAPDQYWWIHRRFKTRPEGEPPFYD